MKKLEDEVLKAVRIEYLYQIWYENLRWNSIGQLIVKLPLTVCQEKLNECIDMDRLHDL